jgi:chromosome segregation ATPase
MSIFQTNIPRADLERQHAQLQADLERLKKEKEQLDHAIVELTHRTKEFRANRARIDAQNQKLKEELARIQRYAEQQVIARNNTKKKAESVRNNKKALSDTLDTETVKQIRRKEAMEVPLGFSYP